MAERNLTFSEGSFQVAFSHHSKGELELCASQTVCSSWEWINRNIQTIAFHCLHDCGIDSEQSTHRAPATVCKTLIILEESKKICQCDYLCQCSNIEDILDVVYVGPEKIAPSESRIMPGISSWIITARIQSYHSLLKLPKSRDHRVQLAWSCIFPLSSSTGFVIFQTLWFWRKEEEVFLHLNKKPQYLREARQF